MLHDLIAERKRKLAAYRAVADPYPAQAARTVALGDLTARFGALARGKRRVSVVGRVTSWRDQGKILFATLADATGKIQAVMTAEETAPFTLLKHSVDIGDFLEVQGRPFTTKRGEKSVLSARARLVAKSVRPVPSEWCGLSDVETRLRKRYLDLLVNPGVRELFVKKSEFWRAMREQLVKGGFLEMETGVLEPVPGGADAEPFVTHLNALNRDFYLRISLELPLKRLLVGGYEKVFEIGRVFRNEGMDRDHLQDYTQMECYAAYWDHRDMMRFVEQLYRAVVKRTTGSFSTMRGGTTVDWKKRWSEVDYFKAFMKATGIDLERVTRDALHREAEKRGLAPEPRAGRPAQAGRGRLIDLIFKKTVQPKLIQPCFLTGHPVDISPLAKADPKHPKKTLRFQVMAAGTELGNGWAELNDPEEQRRRFDEQMKLRAAGDREAQRLDEDFIEALEYGMPPAAGFGLSERLFAVIMDKPIRETVLFPLMREGK
ncbi:lysine--tRNA ligase [Candidatus Jorgensenbacteria bacterium CG23_combo_of_CG06-09_8_20_14_all_54_14]|uniref:Lysine--tRNA ligase n=2 Tax=Candidatus Joergenseniibacteriota TaxID=1752739 RepID=A0A2G9Z9R8_9BACT|nr:MAG: lysine--tRNA ligase [Candidatus Jorgensenbacteria bacterium CG23_combo_of_CG06-09_8_20_14_all_54_14]